MAERLQEKLFEKQSRTVPGGGQCSEVLEKAGGGPGQRQNCAWAAPGSSLSDET